MSDPVPTWLARLLHKALDEVSAERALADLTDLAHRTADTRGARASRRALVFESAAILWWHALSRLRTRSLVQPPTRRSAPMFSASIADVRLSLRRLKRHPGFTALVVVVLALGIGANVSIFTVVNRLFLQPPPLVQSSGDLVRLFRSSGSGFGSALSYPDFRDYQEGIPSLASVFAASSPVASTGRFPGGNAQTEPLSVVPVSWNYFAALGIHPAAGRWFREDEDRTPGTHPVAVVSYGIWQDKFSGRTDIVGQNMLVNGAGFTIVGVVPRGFRGVVPGEREQDVYIPLMMLEAVSPQGDEAWHLRDPENRDNWLSVIGRLAPGRTVSEAQSEATLVAARLYGDRAPERAETVFLTSDYRWHPRVGASLESLTRLLSIAVLVLLVVAVVNVTILLLARASARGREIGILTALGAGRLRVVRQFLTESALIAAGGGVLGALGAVAGGRVAGALLPVRLDPPPTPDVRVLGFAVAISFITALFAGVIPGLRAARPDVVGAIQGRDRRAGGGSLRDLLVVLQVGLSLVLVAGAALFARSLGAARAVDPGFDEQNVLLVSVDLHSREYAAPRASAFLEEGLTRLAAVPGVEQAASMRTAPFRDQWSTYVQPFPGAPAAITEAFELNLNAVSDGYFDAMGISLVSGRPFDARDAQGATPAVIINESFAQMVFGSTDVAGRVVPLRGPDRPGYMIVGVARDVTYYEFANGRLPLAYLSARQITPGSVTFILRTNGPPEALIRPARLAIAAIDPDLPIERTETLSAVYGEQLASYLASARVVGLSGLIALLLAAAGLYGAMAFRVAQRSREIGVRMAVGATQGRVAREFLRMGLRLTGLGLILGGAATLLLGRVVRGLIYGVEPADPIALTVAPLILLLVAIVAVLIPARRAMRIDPMQAMRTE